MISDECLILFPLLLLQPFPESIVRYSEFPGHLGETHILKNVNKLREFLFKCPNAVVFDDQIQVSFFSVNNQAISIIGFFID